MFDARRPAPTRVVGPKGVRPYEVIHFPAKHHPVATCAGVVSGTLAGACVNVETTEAERGSALHGQHSTEAGLAFRHTLIRFGGIGKGMRFSDGLYFPLGDIIERFV